MKNKLKLPHKTPCLPEDQKCPECKEKLIGEFVCMNTGALLKDEKFEDCATMSNKLLGFFTISKHFDSKKQYEHIDIFDKVPHGQCEIYACSTKCLKAIFSKIIDRLN